MFVSRDDLNWAEVAAFYDAGHSVLACRNHFGFSGRAWQAAVERGDVKPRPHNGGNERGQMREAVRALLDEGLALADIARELKISKPTVSYHARRLGIPAVAKAARRYDWGEVQRYYDEGRSMRECCRHFGFSSNAWYQAVDRGVLIPRVAQHPLTRYLVNGRRVNRYHLKTQLFKAGVKENRCERCGLADWLGNCLTMALHHINGDAMDNRLENLQILCPNCHAQTENFAGRNVCRDGLSADAPV